VSFDQGGTYTKVSEQQLTYNPLALFAETAGKLSETLSIAGGGTGATTAAAARANLGLGNVDNTSDAAKPISSATQAALDTKANASEVTTALDLKANTADVTTSLNLKANANEVNTALATKANANEVNTALATKANAAEVTSALATKANASDVSASLALKEDVSNKANTPLGSSATLYPTQNAVKTYVDAQVASATIADANGSTKGKIQLAGDLGGTAAAPTVPGLALKANAADVTAALALKANSSDVNSALATKVDSAFVLAKVVAATIADADASTKGKIQLAGDLAGTAAAPTVPGLALKANTADVTTTLALKAPLASPALSGIPTAPTASAGTSTTQIATTEYTNAAISSALSSTLFSISDTLTSTITNPMGFDQLDNINLSGTLNVSTAQNLANGVDVLKVNQSGIANVGFGLANLFSNTTGNANTSVGYKGLYSNTSGRGNSSFGYYSLFNNTTGNANTANGGQSLFYNTTGGANTASGKFALFSNISANLNTATGYQALYANTTGSNNTATGATSLRSNTTGSSNTASGFGALFKNTTGSQNTANGEVALYSNTTGYSNTASGSFALYKNTTGANNMASGFYALFNNTEGSNNTASGKSALNSNTTGIENTAIGKNALITNTTGSNNTAIGSNADVAFNNLSNATAIGYSASVSTSNTIQLGNADVRNVKTSGTITSGAVTYPNLDGSANQVLITNGNGVASFASIPTLNQNTTGTADNVTGVVAVANGGTGQTTIQGVKTDLGLNGVKVAIGEGAGRTDQAISAIAIGTYAGDETQGSRGIAIGSNTAQLLQGEAAIAIGYAAGQYEQGANSIAIGSFAGNAYLAPNSIVLNASGSALDPSTAGFFVSPIQSALTAYGLYYNTITKEISYGSTTADAGTLTGTTLASNVVNSSLTSVGTLNSATVNGKVIVGASSAATASAVLEVSSTTQGFLPPRMSGAQRDAISSKVAGLVVWCSNCGSNGELQVYNGTEWTNMIGGDASLALVVGMEYQGGKIAYILQSVDPGYDPKIPHGIIAATSDQGQIKWHNGSNTTTGATGTAMGTGLSNTNTIIASQMETATSYAAGLARAYAGGGYTDWYLPSKDELNKLYLNRVAIGGFAANNYWSSTEFGNDRAWRQNFSSGSGYQSDYLKNFTFYVRAIRAF
jgi:hypothetical protein